MFIKIIRKFECKLALYAYKQYTQIITFTSPLCLKG